MDEKSLALKKRVADLTPKSQKVFGEIVYWTAILSAVGALFVPVFILADPSNNVLNPNIVFGAIFAGDTPEAIWGHSIFGAFPGGHFYLSHITKADSWAMIFTVIGCGFGLFGLAPAAVIQVVKEKDYFCALLGSIIAALILFSMIGVLGILL